NEKENLFQKEREQLLELLNDKGIKFENIFIYIIARLNEDAKSIQRYKEEIKGLQEKLKNYLDTNVYEIRDKNYEIMVDKLHDEQIRVHSLLTEKEKIINDKNIKIENLESQLQSWADEATNWVVVADKHTKLITNHNILKKNYEELKFKYIMDMKYIQTNKNEKVKELMRKFS
ncbi:leucine-rich repeat protein, partial [Plasmodium malariae]